MIAIAFPCATVQLHEMMSVLLRLMPPKTMRTIKHATRIATQAVAADAMPALTCSCCTCLLPSSVAAITRCLPGCYLAIPSSGAVCTASDSWHEVSSSEPRPAASRAAGFPANTGGGEDCVAASITPSCVCVCVCVCVC